MLRFQTVVKRGLLYVMALVLAAGYPVVAMADTQEPVSEPAAQTETVQTPPASETVPTQNEATIETAPQTQSDVPAATIIEPEKTTETSQQIDKDINTDVDVNTDVTSNAASGNSTVTNNTTAGSATTGDAQAIANVINSVNSTIGTGGTNQKVATFTQDIMGDVKGDIVLYPLLLKAMLEQKAGEGTSTDINATTNFDLNNTVNLTATSGDAAVTNNTKAGDATTGSATAVANVVNILNSMIAAQDSFIGTINIYGNLEGDILIAPDFIPQMLASNGDAKSGDTKVSQQDTTTIINNISAVAESGAANVFNNTTAGNATTGDADSNIVIFNISGHEIVAKNSLLVFVNVLGKWVGVIVDAPAGATAAMIGNEVTKNTSYTPDLTVNSSSSHGITNTIAVTATSGDATVANNTLAGNATTGQAKAMANVANVSGSQFSASDWFGVLFINVFQNWYGSFGVDTEYGNEKEEAVPQPTGPVQFIPTPEQPKQLSKERIVYTARYVEYDTADPVEEGSEAVLAEAISQIEKPLPSVTNKDAKEPEVYDYRLWIIAGSIFVIGLSAIGLQQLLRQ